MRLLNIIAAATLCIAAIGTSAAANAEPRHNGGHDNGRGNNWNGNHKGWNKKHHRVRCRTEWRHHHKVRVCR